MMRAGTDTGSAMNHLYSRMTEGQPVPVVGMGATVLLWTDRHAATIVSVEGEPGRWLIGVQEDRATVVKGSAYDGSAEYEFTPNPKAPVNFWRFDEGKGWRAVKRGKRGWVIVEGSGLRIGERDEYRDPSF